jgi:FtsZ-interacting cell division protein ZipA
MIKTILIIIAAVVIVTIALCLCWASGNREKDWEEREK